MANKNIFGFFEEVRAADTVNEAGGKAYLLPAKHALAQYAATGVFNGTYYTSAEEQLTKVLELCRQVEPEFVAKLAVYARQRGMMKDMPAFLVAYLATTGRSDLLNQVFHKVIDSPKMLRNVVQILRSGAVGRKSLGSRPKKLVQDWLANRSDRDLFRGSIGNAPSLADVIKMVHPKPSTPERDNMYRYLLGKEFDSSKLPQEVQNFEAFKKNPALGEVPEVPFEMLTALPLTDAHWKQIARTASWTQTRMNLNTFLRHNVFKEAGLDSIVAQRLSSAELVRKSKAFPYQLMAAYLNVEDAVPQVIKNALRDAMEHAVSNIPTFTGKVYVFPDASGSMESAITGKRGSVTSKVTCYDVAALFAASILRRNENARVLPFGDNVCSVSLNPRDSIMTNAKRLASIRGGGTNCAAPLAALNQENAKGDLCIMISDNQSWVQSARGASTPMMREWKRFVERNPNAKLVNIDIQPFDTTQTPDQKNVLNVGGFSDSVFEVVKAFSDAQGESHWTDLIEKTAI